MVIGLCRMAEMQGPAGNCSGEAAVGDGPYTVDPHIAYTVMH